MLSEVSSPEMERKQWVKNNNVEKYVGKDIRTGQSHKYTKISNYE